jgi:uncharacterized membrane protein
MLRVINYAIAYAILILLGFILFSAVSAINPFALITLKGIVMLCLSSLGLSIVIDLIKNNKIDKEPESE